MIDSSATYSKVMSLVRCSKTPCTALTCSTACRGSSTRSLTSFWTAANRWMKKSMPCIWTKQQSMLSRTQMKCRRQQSNMTRPRQLSSKSIIICWNHRRRQSQTLPRAWKPSNNSRLNNRWLQGAKAATVEARKEASTASSSCLPQETTITPLAVRLLTFLHLQTTSTNATIKL